MGTLDKVTIGVFENNESAHWCYRKAGFVETEIVQGEPWNVVEMEIVKKRYYENLFIESPVKITR